MTEAPRPRQKLPGPRKITLPDPAYQPSKAKIEEEHDMPGVSLKTVRRVLPAVHRPAGRPVMEFPQPADT